MIAAAQAARGGCPAGTLVGADEQLAGVGRHGRTWYSKADQGLYLSVVLRPPLESAALPLVMLALGLAVQEAITELTSLQPDLRWPNDVLIDGKKCAGILAQLDGDAVLAGIGINLTQASFPDGLSSPATSLLMSGVRVSREDLVVALAQAIERFEALLVERGADAILRLFEHSSSYALGRRVTVYLGDRSIVGVTCGLDSSGFLLVREDSGVTTTVMAGGVRPAS